MVVAGVRLPRRARHLPASTPEEEHIGATTKDVSRRLSNIIDLHRRGRAENHEGGLYGVTDGAVILAVLPTDNTIYWMVSCLHDEAADLSEEGACPMGDTQPILDAWQRAVSLLGDGEAA